MLRKIPTALLITTAILGAWVPGFTYSQEDDVIYLDTIYVDAQEDRGLPVRIVPECGYMDSAGNLDDCDLCDFLQLVQNILNALIFISVVTATVLFAWAGFLLITNNGNPGRVTRAKSIFVSVLVGIIVILAAWLIVDTIMKTLTDGKLGPWNEVCSDPGIYNPGETGGGFAL
jgi:hypothetical protein